MWTIASGDEALGLVYLPMGNAAADYYSSLRRPPENEYATSLVALDVTTGKPRWHFQAVKKDVWDYDFGAQATLIDYPSPEGAIPALILPSKQGDIYILDRRTGRSEEHTSELQSLMRISYAVFCLKKKKKKKQKRQRTKHIDANKE